MNIKNLLGNKYVMKIRKYSPEILLVTGLVSGAGTVVLACRATTKVGDILKDHKKMMDSIHHGMEYGEIQGVNYTKEDGKKDTVIQYVQTGVEISKLYAPAAATGLISVASILASYGILHKRHVALTAAYSAVSTTFAKYRTGVIERYGAEVDQELRYGLKAEKISATEIDPETGEKKKVKKNELFETSPSPYTIYFDDRSNEYEKDDTPYNMNFLNIQQQFANDKLTARGHIFLNEIFDDLGLPRTKEGQIVGWTKNGPDGFVNFRPMKVVRRHDDGKVSTDILLDFNVEGNVWEKM